MDQPHESHVPHDERGAIAVDTGCRRCGYNLRGLTEDTRCPECGTPVGLSTRGDLLRYADPDWVKTVARGLAIILWMILASILVSCGGAIVGGMSAAAAPAAAAPGPGVGPPGAQTAGAVVQLLVLVVAIISYYGVWLMTEPDPSRPGGDPNLTARKVVRIALIFAIVSQLLTTISVVTPALGALDALIMIGAGVLGLVALVGEYAKYVFYEKLALRIPDDNIARSARIIRYGYVISLGVLVLVGLLAVFAAIAGGGGAFATIGCLALPAGIALLVFGIWTIVMLLTLHGALSRQARIARETWAAAMHPGADTVDPNWNGGMR